MTLIAYTTTMKERATYVGLTGLTWGAGTVLGPVIGGMLESRQNLVRFDRLT